MIGILYVIIFIFTVILEVLIVKKSKGKKLALDNNLSFTFC